MFFKKFDAIYVKQAGFYQAGKNKKNPILIRKKKLRSRKFIYKNVIRDLTSIFMPFIFSNIISLSYVSYALVVSYMDNR